MRALPGCCAPSPPAQTRAVHRGRSLLMILANPGTRGYLMQAAGKVPACKSLIQLATAALAVELVGQPVLPALAARFGPLALALGLALELSFDSALS